MRPRPVKAVLCYEGGRLGAVAGSVERDGVRVDAWVVAERPPEIEPGDAGAMGAWVRAVLTEAGIARSARAACDMPAVRAEVVLKRLPVPSSIEAHELTEMVRLHMVRHVPVGGELAAIDFVRMDDGEAGSRVLAGALPADRLAWRTAVARAAGLRVRRVGLTTSGTARVLAAAARDVEGVVLGIAPGVGSTEFVILEGGRLAFARSIDLARPRPGAETDVEAYAGAVAIEAKRTWMSYRAAPDAGPVAGVLVPGDDAIAQVVARRSGEALERPASVVPVPGLAASPQGLDDATRSALAPLIGLLAESADAGAGMDFAHPRRAPDRGARRRQRVLLVTAASVIVAGTAYTLAARDLQHLREERASLAERWEQVKKEYEAHVRTQARHDHLRRWLDTRTDWLAHLEVLSAGMPDTREAIVDDLRGRAESVVDFAPASAGGRYADGAWTQRLEATFDLAGSPVRQDVWNALRTRLVADERYRFSTRGPDRPDRFELTLTTGRRRPDEPPVGTPARPAPARSGP